MGVESAYSPRTAQERPRTANCMPIPAKWRKMTNTRLQGQILRIASFNASLVTGRRRIISLFGQTFYVVYLGIIVICNMLCNILNICNIRIYIIIIIINTLCYIYNL